MKVIYLILLGLFVLSPDAMAQCPAGIPAAGNPSCIPPSAWPQNAPAQRTPSPAHWESRWGAIATDAPEAVLGTSTGMKSKRQAEAHALSQCRKKGGSNCVLDVSYFDQCAILVTGDKKYSVHTAATIERASELGMRQCRDDDLNCRVHYTNCSPPELVQ
ncbi:DUF4189 domain-containing protein [Lysobacter antibioticus]|uniref:DUF4189 domain-containing protein n=1 Tax=Lysobacter antibioticus TaxID=84531 RepID=UPI001650DAA4|nr:DUF4189 domain-containing protein [Lysobacter antibioticus]